MLLRSSRAAEHLEKVAVIRQLERLGKAGKQVGDFFSKDRWKWGKRIGGGTLVGLTTVPMAAEAAKRSSQGLSEQSFQMRQLGLQDPIVVQIIQNHLKHLENKNYKAICRALGISLGDVISAVEIITRLEPKPGRQFSEEEPQYISPDVFVYKVGDDFVIVLNEDGMPKLRISSFYKEALSIKMNSLPAIQRSTSRINSGQRCG